MCGGVGGGREYQWSFSEWEVLIRGEGNLFVKVRTKLGF